MSSKSILKAALTDFVRRKSLALNAVVCTVDTVDPDKKNCYCIPLNKSPVIPAARLISEDKKGVLILPKEGSMVVVSYLADGTAFVAMFGEVEEIQLMGETLGGVPVVEKILENLNSLKKFVEKMNTAIGPAFSAVLSADAANGALGKEAYDGSMAGASIKFEDMENKKVKHGDGT